jgi:5-methylcytosine-specific restriction endonuclease McrA
LTVTNKQKDLLKQFVRHTCEECKNVFDSKYLTIHHINRQMNGGIDNFRNLKVVCKKCHKLYHFKEF